MVPEKYDVVGLTHKVQVEYGNVGVDFKYVPREGFGWMNASYQIGLSILSKKMRRALGTCTNPEIFFEKSALLQQQKSTYENKVEVEKAAKAITENGQTTAAITVIVPPESSIIIHGSFNSNNLARMKKDDNVPSLSPENSLNNIASVAASDGQHFNNGLHETVNTVLTPDDDESIIDYFL